MRGLHEHANALSLARLRAAGDSLDRAIFASSASTRGELAAHARDLFQESRAFHLEVWSAVKPWGRLEIPVTSVLEMQNRYVACAMGEIQAEFVGGDMATFRHAIETAVKELRVDMKLDAASAFNNRSDEACSQGAQVLARFGHQMPELVAALTSAQEIVGWTATRVQSFATDAELPEHLGVEPHEIVRALRQATGLRLYVLRQPKRV